MNENGNVKLPDKLIAKGLGKRLDGEYECDIAGMLTLDDPSALTNREGHRIKVMAGITVGEIEDALVRGDTDALVALAAVVLTRHGKIYDEDILWDAPIGSALDFDISPRDEEGEDGSPPEESSTLSEDGGESSSLATSDSPENDPNPTGIQDWATHTSDQDSPPGI